MPILTSLLPEQEHELLLESEQNKIDPNVEVISTDLRVFLQRGEDGLIRVVKDEKVRRFPAVGYRYTEGVGGEHYTYDHVSHRLSMIICDDEGEVHDIQFGILEDNNFTPDWETGDLEWLEKGHQATLNPVTNIRLKTGILYETSDYFSQPSPSNT